MTMVVPRHRAFVFGNDIDTDALAPGQYMGGGIEALAAHCLEAVDPDFASSVQPGDIVVAGKNFGMGSSREQAAQALRHLGVGAVVARSFAGIFYRNAINLGLPVFIATGDTSMLRPGDAVEIDIDGAALLTQTGRIALEPLPYFLLDMIADGGLVPHLEKRFAASASPKETAL
ncbi:3-isopropylmalate dehydratase small subunit [Georhizobium profundi]|nr:3-isopropylmalate dehydratase small subunit [Georhizobium profundi]